MTPSPYDARPWLGQLNEAQRAPVDPPPTVQSVALAALLTVQRRPGAEAATAGSCPIVPKQWRRNGCAEAGAASRASRTRTRRFMRRRLRGERGNG